MANEQAANRAKRTGKINFYKFVGKVEGSKGVLMSVGNDKIVTAMNGIGGTLNGIARLLEDYTKLAASNFLKEQKNKTAARREKTDAKKPGKKLGGAGVVGAFGSVVAGAFSGFLSLFSGLLKFFIILPLLNWISNPANKEKLAKIIEGIIGVAKFLADLVSGVVMGTLELIAGFTKLPFWKEILKFGLFLAALGTSFLAFKKLFGGKAAKWVVKTVFSLFKGFFKALVQFSGKLMKFMARRGLRGAGGILKGGKGFLKSKGGKLVAGAAIAVGTSFALDRAADAMMGQDLKDAEDELTKLEDESESDLDRQVNDLGAQLTRAQISMEAAEKPAAKELAEPSTRGEPQPATQSTPTNVGAPQPAPTSGQSAGGLQPAAPPPGQGAPTGSPSMPMASLGGLIRRKRRAEGGAVQGGQKPVTPQQSAPPKVKSKPLNQLPKFIGKTKNFIDQSTYAKQAKLLPKLLRAPMKVVGLVTMGIIANIVKVVSKIPGAGLLVGTIENLIAPIASAFGLKGNVVSKMRGAGIAQAKEVEKKQTKKSQQQQTKQAEEQKKQVEEVAAAGGEKKDKGFFGKVSDGAKGLLGKLLGRAGGGWIDGPQTGYPVSLDGGKSVSFIGHGREYVATKSNGGGASSAFVIPYDTPATRGNKNLTERREKEARSAGFKFAAGGRYRDPSALKREEEEREKKFGGDPRPPIGQFAEGGEVKNNAQAIIAGAKKTIGRGRGVGDMCANTTRAALAAAGHPYANKTTKRGDLDTPKGTAYSGRNFAASFGGTDMGTVIRDRGSIKAGDIILWREYSGGRYGKGAITHVGIAADDGLKNQYDHNRSKGFQYRPHWDKAAGTEWFAGIRLGGKASGAGADTSTTGGADTGTAPSTDTSGGGGDQTDTTEQTPEQQFSAAKDKLESLITGAFTSAPSLFERAAGGAVQMLNKGKPKLSKQQLSDMVIEEGKGEAKSPNEGGWNKFAAGGALKKFAAGGIQNGRLPDSELVSVGNGHRLHKSVASQFLALKAAAAKDGFAFGSQLKINSSYRSLQRQKELYAQLGPGTAAYPGTSNHGWGKAVDLWYTNAAYKWLRKNAGKFGFRQIPGYATDNPDGHEAWHWENVSGGGEKSASGVKTESAKGGDQPAGGGLDEAARAGGGGEAKTAAQEETPEQKKERLTGMLNTAFGKIAGLAGTSLFSTATGGSDDYNAIVSRYGGGSAEGEDSPIQLDPSTIKAVQPGENYDLKATSGIPEAPKQNNNVKGATESVEQVKAKVADEKKVASKELTQKVVTQNLSAQAQINSIQAHQKNSGKSGSNTIDIPLTGGSTEPDDIILYRPGFGLFSGVMNAGGGGL